MPRIINSDFSVIRAWQSGDSAVEVATELQMTEQSLKARISKLRNGVRNDDGSYFIDPLPQLKLMPRASGGGRTSNIVEEKRKNQALMAELAGISLDEQAAAVAEAKQKKAVQIAAHATKVAEKLAAAASEETE